MQEQADRWRVFQRIVQDIKAHNAAVNPGGVATHH